MTFDLQGLGDWADLPFFKDDLPLIENALAVGAFLPPPENTFRALQLAQPSDVKVVIIGQDPYHTPGKADGLAFSIPDGFGGRLDSLGNIFKEIETDLQVKRTKTSLDDWADQGVLLLNTALTVKPGAAKSHDKLGWKPLVQQVLAYLDEAPRAFVFWGNPAQAYRQGLSGKHLVLTAPHPSPLSCHRGFFGSRPFSTVNQWLTKQGQTPIYWGDPS